MCGLARLEFIVALTFASQFFRRPPSCLPSVLDLVAPSFVMISKSCVKKRARQEWHETLGTHQRGATPEGIVHGYYVVQWGQGIVLFAAAPSAAKLLSG